MITVFLFIYKVSFVCLFLKSTKSLITELNTEEHFESCVLMQSFSGR